MQKGDVMGHEFMGIVESVGPGVKDVKVGDRVVTAFDIACGACRFCKDLQVYSGCDTTNDSVAQEALYGHKTGGELLLFTFFDMGFFFGTDFLFEGIFGYSHMTGGWDGGQAQYVRVPYADTMVLKVPAHLPDLSAVLLSDILPTGWHATELGNVQEGDVVAIWGCGPVGMLAAASAFYKKASRVIIIDNNEYRLNFAKNHLSKLETINFTQTPTLPQLRKLVPDGPDVSIEAVGLHYAPPLHVAQMTIGLESDPPTILNEMIMATRKGGTLGVVGVYAGLTNGYNIGGFMEKGLKMGAGQTPVQKYWPTLLKLVESGELDPKWVVTHELPLEKAPEGYKIFNGKEDNCVKIVLHP